MPSSPQLRFRFGLAVALAAVCSACQAQPPAVDAPVALVIDHNCIDAADNVIPADQLDRVRQMKTVFAHQSVGFDMIHGLQALSAEQPRYRLQVKPQIQYDPGFFQRSGGFGEWFVNQNGQPAAKIDEFGKRVTQSFGRLVNVAMLKLCYADFIERTDAQQTFTQMRDCYAGLQRQFPSVRLVWFTCPLVQSTRLNEKRAQYNGLVRAYVKQQGATLLDIADIECHTPEGAAVTEQGGEMLFKGYGRDEGGHLNDLGAKRVGRAWWWLMSRIAGWAGPA